MYNITLCPTCEQVVYRQLGQRRIVAYTLFCEKRRITEHIRIKFKRSSFLYIDDPATKETKLCVLECHRCYKRYNTFSNLHWVNLEEVDL